MAQWQGFVRSQIVVVRETRHSLANTVNIELYTRSRVVSISVAGAVDSYYEPTQWHA